MRLIWTEQAVGDLEAIVSHIQQDSPEAARRVAKVIFDTVMTLSPSISRSEARGRRR